MRRLLTVATALLSVGAVSYTPSQATTAATVAQDSERERENRRRTGQTLSTSTGRDLVNALNFLNAEPPQPQQALPELNKILARSNLPAYDRSTVLEIRAATYFQLDNPNAALQDFVQILNADVLPFDRLKQIRYNVAQLYFQQENYTQAIRFIREYLAESDSVEDPNAWYIMAAAYVSQENYQQALEPGRNAVRYDTKQEKRSFLLLNLILSELSRHSERVQLVERMIELFPEEESLWGQLSGLYSTLDRPRDAFATLEVAYKAGLITDEPKILVLAQYYSELDNPFRGAKLLEQEMASGTVKRNLKNLRLLGQLWSMSREQTRAISVLSEAAQIDDNGELYYRIGQGYMANEEYNNALRNLNLALQKGGLSANDRGDIHILRGTAYFNIDSDTREGRQRARRAFVQAADVPRSRRAAQGWIEYIDAIQATLDAQDEVERIQRAEQRRQAIRRCESIIDVAELGGQVDAEALANCRTFIAEAEAEDAAAEAGEATEAGEGGGGEAPATNEETEEDSNEG